jgi:hypothetical protein
MGGFAAMAQNRYGLYILGIVGILFGLLFAYQCYFVSFKTRPADPFSVLEPACLALLSFLFTLRIFYIHFTLIEGIFSLSIILLIFIYIVRISQYYRYYKLKNFILAILISAFYLTIILYLTSLVSVIIFPSLSLTLGILAFILFVVILIAGTIRGNLIFDGEQTSFYKTIWHFKDYSVLVISLFFLFALYAGFTRLGLLPKIYSDEYPKAYYDLVNKAESGKDSVINGKRDYQIFKEQYDDFIKRNIVKPD